MLSEMEGTSRATATAAVRRVRSSVLFLLFLGGLCFGCEQPDLERSPHGPLVRDSAGIEIITIPKDRFEGIPEWTLGSTLTVVGADASSDHGIIGRVADAGLFQDGRLVVGDALAQRLTVYHSDGSFSHTIGRDGTGPGDIRTITRIAVEGDTVFLLDRSLRRLSKYDQGGRFLGSERLAFPTRGGPSCHYSRPIGLPVLVNCTRIPPPIDPVRSEGRLPDSMSLQVWQIERDSSVRVLSLAHSPAFFARLSPSEIDENVNRYRENLILAAPLSAPLSPTVEVGFSDDGIILGFSDRFELRFLNQEGFPSRIIRASLDQPTAGDENQRALALWIHPHVAWDATGTRPLYERLARTTELPEMLPHFYQLVVGETGDLWLQMQPVREEDGEGIRWLRMSPTGKPIGYLRIPVDLQILEFHDDKLVAVSRDEYDAETVVVLGLQRTDIGP